MERLTENGAGGSAGKLRISLVKRQVNELRLQMLRRRLRQLR
jgi:hypothetical protein